MLSAPRITFILLVLGATSLASPLPNVNGGIEARSPDSKHGLTHVNNGGHDVVVVGRDDVDWAHAAFPERSEDLTARGEVVGHTHVTRQADDVDWAHGAFPKRRSEDLGAR
ncbi:hypothetical protein DFP72DRAFT_922673 [Ephemerocybe angulata]|uniref:Uncharacterized protein n=1 Tax=Ephemerocybe angulata TaxID=980116 RepID=A0A8H6HGH5_9AGAR|nr:hypothetical protein DFP72DRAFT_922673 [Tulosesus angulatus]